MKYQSVTKQDTLKPTDLNKSRNIRVKEVSPPNTTVSNRHVKTQIKGWVQ